MPRMQTQNRGVTDIAMVITTMTTTGGRGSRQRMLMPSSVTMAMEDGTRILKVMLLKNVTMAITMAVTMDLMERIRNLP